MKIRRILFLDSFFYSTLLLVGIFMVIVNINNLSKYEPSFRKSTTIGVITESRIVSDIAGEQGLLTFHLKFSYFADGQRYEKTAIENHRFSDNASHVIAEYPVGTEVPVYYPSGKPEDAIFQSGIGHDFNATKPRLFFAGLGAVLAIFIVYAAIRNDSYTVDRNADIPAPDPNQHFFTGTTYVRGTPNYDQDE